MKKLHTIAYPAIALLSLAAASVSFAQGVGPTANPYAEGYSQQNEAPGTLTRAQVVAELQQARSRGDNRVYASGYSQQNDGPSVLTRAEVRAQAIAALRSGEAQALISEDGGAAYEALHRRSPAGRSGDAIRVANAAR